MNLARDDYEIIVSYFIHGEHFKYSIIIYLVQLTFALWEPVDDVSPRPEVRHGELVELGPALGDEVTPLLTDGVEPGQREQGLGSHHVVLAPDELGRPRVVAAQEVLLDSGRCLWNARNKQQIQSRYLHWEILCVKNLFMNRFLGLDLEIQRGTAIIKRGSFRKRVKGFDPLGPSKAI